MGHISKSTTSELTIFDALSLAAEHRGNVHLFPRIPLQCPYSFKRIQFPVRLAYAMTINNKSQGQTLQKVGISLKQEVFSHGQLYTAFTRTTSGENMTLAIPDNLKESRLIKNVVWRQAMASGGFVHMILRLSSNLRLQT